MKEARAAGMVVLPEWQGIGIGTRFLNTPSEMRYRGGNRYNKPMRTLFHTPTPGLSVPCGKTANGRRFPPPYTDKTRPDPPKPSRGASKKNPL
ncbi:hypothetical protein JY21_06250 [Neisseria meningitidis]|nr:hypothetical protein JY21_06250 [Neisseria meningitidis]